MASRGRPPSGGGERRRRRPPRPGDTYGARDSGPPPPAVDRYSSWDWRPSERPATRRPPARPAVEAPPGPPRDAARRRRPRPRSRRDPQPPPETGSRVLTAIPAIIFAIAIVAVGGVWFAAGIFALGVLALHELYQLMRRARPVDLAGYLALAGLLAAALYGGARTIPLAFAAVIPLTFLLAVVRRRREDVAWGVAATVFGVLWIGVALVHALLLRELDHGGALLTAVLIGTFVGDAAAYFVGRARGRRPLAPGISPNKTLEGFVAGVLVGTLAYWAFAVGWHDFIPGGKALLVGLCVAMTAPFGDLFESMIKRDLEAKDTGRFFGPHGGVLDRLDAVLFTAVAGYYATVVIL